MSSEQFRVLVIEELTACGVTWAGAVESMRQEAVAMVQTVLQDLQQVPGCQPQVLLSPAVADLWRELNLLPTGVMVLQNATDVGCWLQQAAELGPECDSVLLIAPESEGLLERRLQQLNFGHWRNISSINCSAQMAALFADKHQTAIWLQEQGVPAVPGVVVTHAVQQQLLALQEHSWSAESPVSVRAVTGSAAESASVIKPRFGVGCGEIQWLRQQFAAVELLGDAAAGAEGEWLLQPFLDGIFCSAAIVGRHDGQRLILPAGEQRISWQNRRPVYLGGSIPAEPPVGQAVEAVMQRIALALPAFAGWIGVDFVVSRPDGGELQIRVMEVNPRLCTSFVGYHRACDSSLLGWILAESAAVAAVNVPQFPHAVRFLADGSVLSG